MARRTADIPTLVSRARDSDQRSVARLISLVEDDSGQLREVMSALTAYVAEDRAAGKGAHIIGLTGPPGVGKSTSTSMLVGALRSRGKRVGVLAIDPSSPFTGGALLGDRVRMQDHALDKGVYIRSMASRGHLGGLSVATPQALRVLDAAGCDVILVETVGVGQSEVEIASMADTTLVLLAPGMGDGIQAAKAGILEIGDIYVVNKSDREGALQLRRELRSMMSLSQRGESGWRAPIVNTVATDKDGVEELLDAIGAHWDHLCSAEELQRRRLQRARVEIEAIALASYRRAWRGLTGVGLDDLARQVESGLVDPYAAADALIAG
ncbi:MAG TPA: methylmalonyl Co-A mutase-associated GTPase MeaB [Marmoricola sp.]|nr:methylmalonyl Co-A mutase-associated GTPase MeaB [Nocardioidaceae bacterium]HMY08019.1 methylmalonyl Co-A mutase-associated GTPase MeaB [Marmoricola sp.]HRV68862.1 methylmalonyl Co-A mutase-associated GTPase MeaB [Marmoricola sp.]